MENQAINYCISGDLSKLVELVKRGASVKGCNGKDTTVTALLKNNLHEEDKLKFLKYLVRHGASVEERDRHDTPPIYIAAKNGHLKILEYLVKEKSVNVNVKIGSSSIIYLLVKYVPKKVSLDVIPYLIEMGAVVEKGILEELYNNNRSLAFISLPILRLLIESGADYHFTTLDGDDILTFSIKEHDLPNVRYLVSLGIDVNSVRPSGRTPLMEAFSNPDMIKLLLEHGADPNVTTKYGTVLHVMIRNLLIRGGLEVLFEYGADPNIQDPDGNTPLHFDYSPVSMSSLYNLTPFSQRPLSKDTILLLKNGADYEIENHEGKTFLDICIEIYGSKDKALEEIMKHLPVINIKSAR